MNENTEVDPQAGPSSSGYSESTSKKPYRKPELKEWGTIVDLTRGPLSGFQDFPAGGGTQPV